MKSLSVYSNGRWVATGSLGGTVAPDQTIIEHTEGLPAVGPGITPLQVIAAWSAYEPGIHLFTDGGKTRNLVLLSKASLTGTTNTPNGVKPTASESLTATVFIDGTGTTFIKVTTTAIDGVQSNAASEIVANMGGQWVKMNSTKGDEPFAPTGMADIFGGAVAPDFTGLATEQFVTDAIAAVPSVDVIKAIEGKDIQPRGIAVGEGNIAFQGVYSFTVENVGIGPRPVVEYRDGAQAKTLVCLTRDDAYTKAEVDTKADLTNTAQAITAQSVTAEAVQFISQNAPNTALLRADVGGQERLVYAVGSKKFPIAFTTEITSGGSVDLSAYAKLNDPDQVIIAKGLMAGTIAFDLTNGLTYMDTGEGYGKRLYFVTDALGTEEKQALVYVSDLEPLNQLLPRIQTLEGKAAPTVDLSPYITTTDLAATLAVYAKTPDVAAFVQENYAQKATTYTKDEVETRLLEVPSPMKYLQWGGAFQKIPVGAASKDKWIGAGLIPSIQIVKGKRYRLEMTTKIGSLNADYAQCWIGFRFNYRAINELPCTKQPLVTMGGFGHTTVLATRPAIAATAVATTTPTRADRFRVLAVDDWISADDIIEYAVEFEADRDIASANFVPEICFGGTWGVFPTDFTGIVAVFRQMD